MENPIKMVDLGGKPPIFGNIHMIDVMNPSSLKTSPALRMHGMPIGLTPIEANGNQSA